MKLIPDACLPHPTRLPTKPRGDRHSIVDGDDADGFPVPVTHTGADETDPWEYQDADGDGWSNGDEAYVYFTDPYDWLSYPGSYTPPPDSVPPTTPTDAWLADYNGDALDNIYGFWVGVYQGPLFAAFVPQGHTGPLPPGMQPAIPGVSLTLLAGGWPDGGPDSDQDGLSDAFESANSVTSQVQTGVDEFNNPVYETVDYGLSPYNADSDGDLIPDGWEVLALTPMMLSAGLVPYDPTINEAYRDDDGDGVATAEEYLIWGTSPLNTDTDGDGLTDYDEIAVLFSDPLDPTDPGEDPEDPANPENGGGTGGMDGSGSGGSGGSGDGGSGSGGGDGSGSGGGDADSGIGDGDGTASNASYPPMGFKSRTHSAYPPTIAEGSPDQIRYDTLTFTSGEYAVFQLPENTTILDERTTYTGSNTRFGANFYFFLYEDPTSSGVRYDELVYGDLADWDATVAARAFDGWSFDPKWETDWVGESFTELDVRIHDSGAGAVEADPYQVVGPAFPGDAGNGVLVELVYSELVYANHYSGTPYSGYLGGMGFGGNEWEDWMRETHGDVLESYQALPSAIATLAEEGDYPRVSWTEVWLQADTLIPAGLAPAERTLTLHATSEQNGVTQDYFGMVRFKISESERSSANTPEVSGNIPGNWIEVNSDGFVRLNPPVEAGVANAINFLPVGLNMDIDNDGEIGGSDSSLAQKAFEQGATEEDVEKGTEYLFLNDDLSNGIWDKDDDDAPGTAKDDDDAQEIAITEPAIDEGELWLDFVKPGGTSAISLLSFYDSRECTTEVPLKPGNRFPLGQQDWPDEIFVRADGNASFPDDNPQITGDLVLKLKVGTEEVDGPKIKLTVVKALGAKKYFHAARDYVYENNWHFYLWDWTEGGDKYRVISMVDELLSMRPYDSLPPTEKGIAAVIASQSDYDVIINGNQCDDIVGSNPNRITRICHGRVVDQGEVIRPPSDDRIEKNPIGSPLAGPLGAFIAKTYAGTTVMRGGIVPATPTQYNETADYYAAMGGLSTNYEIRESERNQLVGRAELSPEFTVVFTASQIDGSGGILAFKDAAVKSGVATELEDEDASINGRGVELLCLDGSTSVAVAYKNGAGVLEVGPNPGSKHTNGFRYAPNTYLRFKCQKPRQ